MPATIDPNTIAGSIERHDGYSTKKLEITGTSLMRETVTAANVAEVRAAVQAFGARVRAAHPDASFMVSISIRKGSRKPNGYDKGYFRNGLGQEDFLHVIDRRTAQAADPTKADAPLTAPGAA